MELFQSTRNIFAFLGIHQPNRKRLRFVKGGVGLFLLGSLFACESKFLFYEAKTWPEYAEIFYNLFAVSSNILEYSVHIWKSEELYQFTKKFESVIEKRSKNPESRRIYQKFVKQANKLSEIIHFALLNVTIHFVMWPKFLTSSIAYFRSDLQDNFQLPYLNWYPFDWRNPLGYLIAFALEYSSAIYAIGLVVCKTVFIFETFSMLNALSREELQIIKSIQTYNSAEFKLFVECIQILSDAKQLTHDFLKAYKLIIVSHFIWSMLTICGTLLLIQMEISHGTDNLAELLQPISEVFWSFTIIFIYCEFGERVSDGFNEVYDEFCQHNWYLYPMEVQRMLPKIVVALQQPVIIQTITKFSCSRDALKQVLKGGFSYFMMARRIGN